MKPAFTRKLVGIALCVCLVSGQGYLPLTGAVPASTAQAAAEATEATVKTTGGSLNLRLSPAAGTRVLTTIPNGTKLAITERGTEWCGTSYNGYSGYVMASFLSFGEASPTATATPTATPVPAATPAATAGSFTAYVKTTGGSLNLRESAQAGARVLKTIPDKTKLTITQKGATWCKTSYAGVTGYVMTSFLTFSGSPTQTPAATQAPVTTPGTTASPGATPTASPAPYDTSVFTRTLKLGYTGRDVVLFKERLSALLYPASTTGTYDAATIAAVKLFQKYNGLTADGIAGAKTFTALFSAHATAYSGELAGYKPIRIDDTDASTATGSGVTRLQTALKSLGFQVKVTGTFDTATHNAVVAFQLRNGMTPEGIADEAFQIRLYGGNANNASTPYDEPGADAGRMDGPAASVVSLLHWYNTVKPSLKGGQSLLIYDPATGLGWTLRVYACGQHADCEPKTLLDTQIMNRSFGSTSWTVHPVYIMLPDGRWTMATMHNRPHLYGSITGNGFSGHLCVHFLRDLAECQKNAPEYGMENQRTLRKAWKSLTGETIN
jgi:peptidoglycan hydrolase-like protein with peptidoglycan-binding domain